MGSVNVVMEARAETHFFTVKVRVIVLMTTTADREFCGLRRDRWHLVNVSLMV